MQLVTGVIVAAVVACFAVPPQAQVLPATQGQSPAQTPLPTASPTPTPTPTATPAAGPADYLFPTGAGLIFYYVKPGRASDFEAILERIKEALAKAQTPMLKQQALNWRIYKSAEAVTDAAVFVFVIDPAITTANYDPLLALNQVLPAEVQPLFDRIKEAVIKIERMGLTKIR